MSVNESTVAYWEQGSRSPSEDSLSALARALSVPVEFFERESLVNVNRESVSFRSLRTLTRTDRDRACAAAELASEIAQWIDARYKLPAVNVPELSGATPTVAAMEMRRQLKVGHDPLPSVVTLLEFMGVRCFSLGMEIAKADALSTWVEGTPIVLFNVSKSAERSRNDASHELGHLTLHGQTMPAGDQAEREAVAFAAEFLVPRESLLREAPRRVRMLDILILKRRWGVSAAFMLKRLSDLDRLSDWQTRSLWRQLNVAGYRSAEPDGLPREQSQVLTQVVSLERQKSKRPFASIAQQLSLATADVRARFEGLLPLALHTSTGDIDSPSNQPRPKLQLVE